MEIMKSSTLTSFITGLAVGAAGLGYLTMQKRQERRDLEALIEKRIEELESERRPVVDVAADRATATENAVATSGASVAEAVAQADAAGGQGSKLIASPLASSSPKRGIASFETTHEAVASYLSKPSTETWARGLSEDQRAQLRRDAVAAAMSINIGAIGGAEDFNRQLGAAQGQVQAVEQLVQESGVEASLLVDESRIHQEALAALANGTIKHTEIEEFKEGLRTRDMQAVRETDVSEFTWGIEKGESHEDQ